MERTTGHESCGACCGSDPVPSLRQSIDELEFERGLWTAAIDNDVERIKLLLSKGVQVDVLDQYGHTSLHYAAKRGNYDAALALLDAGASPNARTHSLLATPLHRASRSGHARVVSLLLSRGADRTCLNVDGKTAADLARENGHKDVVEILSMPVEFFL